MNRRVRSAAYVYPFPSDKTTVGRIDQGQDFGGSGAIRAIGRARVLKLGAPGWPGGAGILYQLLEGPHRGRSVYVYEGVKPSVRVGQIVAAGQAIGSIIPGTSTGIETGWATTSGEPLSHSEYTEGKETASGKGFAAFLATLKGGSGGGSGGFSSFGPLGTAEEIVNAPSEAIAGLLEGGASKAGDAASGVAGDVISGIFGANHPEALMLNIGLVGGGAFLVYYGAALMLGVKKPTAPLTAPLKGAPA